MRTRPTLMFSAALAAMAVALLPAAVGATPAVPNRLAFTGFHPGVPLGGSAQGTTGARVKVDPNIIQLIGQPASVQLPATPTGAVSYAPAVDVTCTTDVSLALQTWIDATPDNSTLRLAAGACYRVERTLVFSHRNKLLFDGQGATIRANTDGTGYLLPRQKLTGRYQISTVDGTDLTFTNVKVAGPNVAGKWDPAFYGQSGFWIAGSQRVLLASVGITGVYGDFVTVAPGDPGTGHAIIPQHVTVRDSILGVAGRQGLAVSTGEHLAFYNNRLGQSHFMTVDLEPDSNVQPLNDIYLLDNAVYGPSIGFFANTGWKGPADGIYIQANHLIDRSFGVQVSGRADLYRQHYVITDNVEEGKLSSTPLGIVNLKYVRDAVVQRNIQHGYFVEPGKGIQEVAVQLSSVTGASVTNNDFTGVTSLMSVDASWVHQGVATPWPGPASTGIAQSGNRFGETGTG